MFWLVESETQFKEFLSYGYKKAFIEIIPFSNCNHPIQNNVCAIYIRPLVTAKGFIIPISHSETLNINIDNIIPLLLNLNVIYTRDKKEFLHYFPLKNLIDITLNSPPYIQEFTQTHNIFQNRYPTKDDVNKIIPIVKHYEYCENTYNNLKEKIDEPINEFYNNKATVVFNAIERSGLRINREEFQMHFYDINSDYTYTQFNFKTLTKRPSNKFKGVNYAALNKNNNSRSSFIPRNDILCEFDISAYHPTLLGYLIKWVWDEEDIHQSFANMYEVDYQKAKELTFKQLYGGIFEKYKDLEFFKKVQIYTNDLWKKFNSDGFIECPISKHKFYKNKLENMNPQKLLNYLLQNLETSVNICIMWDIFKLLKGKKTKLILYTYDSFLFDVCNEEKEVIIKIKQLFFDWKLKIKTSYGDSYNFK
jgi:hypothetical protein